MSCFCGQGYAWGGKNHWWFEIRPDSHWQDHWRGDTTERSRLLLQTLYKEEPDEIEPDVEEDEEEKEASNIVVSAAPPPLPSVATTVRFCVLEARQVSI